MKKNIIYSFTFIAIAVLLTACGSNSKADSNGGTSGDASMSILMEGIVKLDITRGCEKLFVVHAVDGNGNPIPNLNVDASIIINNKASGSSTGTIQTTEPITFLDGSYNFNSKNVIPGDKIIILPTANRHDASYAGDWDIHKVEGSALTLWGAAYNLETTDQLNYIVGNGSSYVAGYGTAVAHIEKDDTNGTTVTNNEGHAYFKVIYDPSLIGHTMVVGAHTSSDYRIGAAVIGKLPDCMGSTDSNTSSSNSNSSTCSGSSGSCGKN
jgi:hypothetical protein